MKPKMKSISFGQWVDQIKPQKKILDSLSVKVVKNISKLKGEPVWMLKRRLEALKIFKKISLPKWGPDLTKLNFGKIHYYSRSAGVAENDWQKVPGKIKKTFDRLGVPKLEAEFLGGAGAQYDSEMVYHSLDKDLKAQGVIFLSLEQAISKYPKLVKKYFGQVVPTKDNKLAALNSAVWSGGSFIYVPPKVKVKRPLHAYFRLNARGLGQFERTLIIADKGSQLEYIEGCTAPYFNVDGLHAAVVEIIAEAGAKIRYTTVQNWPNNVYNLVTKRALLKKNSYVEWIDGNFGSKLTMKYPSLVLAGPGAKGKVISLALAGSGQVMETGSKAVHLAPWTSSQVIAKSISYGQGRSSYRGLVKISKTAKYSQNKVCCDALLLNSLSRADTYPKIEVKNNSSQIEHEAAVSRLSQQQLNYLQSRGFDQNTAAGLAINGFVAPIRRALPAEFAIELERLLDLEMAGSVA